MKRIAVFALFLVLISVMGGCALSGAPDTAETSSHPADVTSDEALPNENTDSEAGSDVSGQPAVSDGASTLPQQTQTPTTSSGTSNKTASAGNGTVNGGTSSPAVSTTPSDTSDNTSSTGNASSTASGTQSNAAETSSSFEVDLPIIFF